MQRALSHFKSFADDENDLFSSFREFARLFVSLIVAMQIMCVSCVGLLRCVGVLACACDAADFRHKKPERV